MEEEDKFLFVFCTAKKNIIADFKIQLIGNKRKERKKSERKEQWQPVILEQAILLDVIHFSGAILFSVSHFI